MNWFTLGLGLFFVMMGVSMILRLFGIHLHLGRVVLALFIIAMGLKMLIPGFFGKHCQWVSGEDHSAVVFSESRVEHKGPSADYSVAFGSQEVDLSKVDLEKGNVTVRVHAAFGSSKVKLDSKTPVKIMARSAFASVEMPGGNSAVFGTLTYRSNNYREDAPVLLIEADAAFASIEIVD